MEKEDPLPMKGIIVIAGVSVFLIVMVCILVVLLKRLRQIRAKEKQIRDQLVSQEEAEK